MSDKTPVLTKKDLRRCALRSWINVNLFNYETILPFWNYGAKNLAAATDSDWKE